MSRLQIVGGGKMGEALLAGLLRSGYAEPPELIVVEPVAARREELSAAHPGVGVRAEIAVAEGTIVAVKPSDVPEVVGEVAASGCPRLLSIAAGVTLATLEAAAGTEIRIIRAMPNTPATIGVGAAAIAGGSAAGEDDLAWAEEILGAVGTVVRVTESQLDAVTGLSGSGPAYVFLVVEALADAGVLVGLSRPVAEQLATQTLLGAAQLLASSDQSAAELRAGVTSPGGTTAAGVHQLELAAVRAAFSEAVLAATKRSRELG
ncbi:MAG: pyrroline-5-carboxylate reductase [Microthrixaceae bacterium]|nr:pyrroline-5-carboxylate reductase [Microthrixaceae bacterium]